jgi:hypothetical protein
MERFAVVDMERFAVVDMEPFVVVDMERFAVVDMEPFVVVYMERFAVVDMERFAVVDVGPLEVCVDFEATRGTAVVGGVIPTPLPPCPTFFGIQNEPQNIFGSSLKRGDWTHSYLGLQQPLPYGTAG